MSIPKQKEIYRPLLESLSKKQGHVHLSILRERMAKYFKITKEEREVRLETSGYRRFDNRVSWAVATLKRFGLLNRPRYGHYQITSIGKDELEKGNEINYQYLVKEHGDESDDTSQESKQKKKEDNLEAIDHDDVSPAEEIENALQKLNKALEREILERLRDPNFDSDEFEHLTVDLLIAMGYGESGERTQRSRDGGIDGIVNEDKLGLSQIGIQAKCNAESNKVGLDRVVAFSGALDTKGLQKGCLITTSSFTADAENTARSLSRNNNKNIRLIDGDELAKLMREHNIGCGDAESYGTKKIDENFWNERVQTREDV